MVYYRYIRVYHVHFNLNKELRTLIKYCFQALGVFGLCQLHCFIDYIRSKMTQDDFQVLFKAVVMATVGLTSLVGGVLTVTGKDFTN